MTTMKKDGETMQHPEARTIVTGDAEDFDRRVNEAFREGFVVAVNAEAKAAFHEGMWVHTFFVVMVKTPPAGGAVVGALEDEVLGLEAPVAPAAPPAPAARAADAGSGMYG